MSEIASFRAKLAPLVDYLDDAEVTELAINRPRELWLGRQGQRYMEHVEVPDLTFGLLESLAEVTASYTSQETDRERPLLAATIPIDLSDGIADAERGGYRVQVVRPPAVEEQTIALCIRKPTLLDIGLSEYSKHGAFADVNRQVEEGEFSDDRLRELYKASRWEAFLRGAVRAHKNIVISAGTNAGKTTLLNALLKEIPEHERVVTIEDSREVRPPQRNCLHMLYSRGGQGVAKVTAVDLLEAMLRLTPDRPIMGELRGAEAYSYLELLNSGHTGSITTIHADSPNLMFDRLAQMVMRFGSPMPKDQIIDYARSLIQVVVQFKRSADGRRYVSEIQYEGA
ncbi:P-type DNA transfer ATPase VirB11 [Caballeronia terrestris]|uniref:Type IV secretion system protein n=1 Tax=Caballeronia terrestris TaxID=1226301 RepID=A0A158K2V4_9BURK|nr:P-type DNA transfer ATPase VirB11 [Caballeronia terrestris]SAL75456.1 P-type DNA transfer ATPase VirB11 [Caballeronia terrestris]